MTDDLLGQVFSLLAALTWAFALIYFKRSGEHVNPAAMNLFKNVLALILFGLTLLLAGDSLSTLASQPREEIFLLAISGFLGITLADTLLLHSLNTLGVGLFVVVDCTYSPIVLAASWLMLDEHLRPLHYLGGALVLASILLSTRHPVPRDRTRKQIFSGIAWGLTSIFLLSIGIVMIKPVVEISRFPLLWAATIRLLAGTAALALLIFASKEHATLWSVFKPRKIWKYSIPATICGTYLSMVFWIAGFKYTQAAIAAVLNQTSIIFAMILAALILKEKLTRRKIAAAALAFAGVALVTLG